jgi:hypothetical protein
VDIKADDMMELLIHLNDALHKEHQWMGYGAQLSKVTAKDIDCFKDKVEAENFYKDELKGSNHSIVPIEPIWFIVQDLLILQHGNELSPMDIKINVPQVIKNYENQLLTIKTNTMNEKNLEYLKDNLKYQGFGESLQRPLEQNIAEGKTEFTLAHKATYNNQAMENTLHFKKGDQNDMYFFNKYDAKLLQPEERAQTFYLDKGNGVTTKEAFNLLNGRPVHKELTSKEGEKYTAWVQLDLSKKEENGNYKLNRYHENYGYNLEKALGQYPIKEMSDPKLKEDLMKSMEKGNLQAVKMEVKGKEETFFIQAEPQYKDINVFNKNQSRLDKDQVASLKAEPAPGQSVKQEQKQMNNHKQTAGGGDDEGPELKKKRTRKKGIAI